MPISPYNHEGYFDPTAWKALNAVDRQQRQERYRPIVCIIAPEDMDNAIFRRFAVEKHCIPLIPTSMLSGTTADENDIQFMTIALLSRCSELWCFGDAQFTDAEWYARRFTTECEEVSQ